MNIKHLYDPIHDSFEMGVTVPFSDVAFIPKANMEHLEKQFNTAELISDKLKVLVEMVQLIENMRQRRTNGTEG